MKINEISSIGNRCFGFVMSRSLSDCTFPDSEDYVCSEYSEKSDLNNSLFDLVFSVDPRSNLPVGDVAMYMSENTSPDVKRFIELNLHNPVDSGVSASGDFSSLSDDDIISMTRDKNESISSYRNRMIEYIKSGVNKSSDE